VSQPEQEEQRRRWRTVSTILVATFVVSLTLLPARVSPSELARRASFWCILGCGNEGLRDLISNVLLFIPVGWVASYWTRPRRALAICLLATILIEGLQATLISGRDSSLRDILSNTVGGATGIGLYLKWARLRWPGATSALRLASASSLAWVLLLGISGLGTRLAPTERPWFGQWTPDLENYTLYPGQVLDVRLNGERPSRSLIPEPIAIRQEMRDGRPWMVLRAVSGPPPRRTALMFGITDDHEEDQLFVGQDRIALLLHLRSAFEAWGLRELIARQPLFPGRTPGDTVTIQAGLANRALTIHSQSGTRQLTTELPLTVGLGWSGLMPFRYPVFNEWVLFNAVWLAGLILPTGYWAGRWSPGRAPALLMLVLVGGLGAVPYLTAAAPTTRPEWLGALLGAVLGCSAGILSRRRAPPAEA
jgi:VanZ like family